MPSERIQRQIDRLLDEMEEAASAAQWSDARDKANDVLAMDSRNEDAQAFLAVAERRLGASGSSPTRSDGAAPPPAAPPHPERFAGDRYEVLRHLGDGGTKRVFLVRDTRLDREVALAL